MTDTEPTSLPSAVRPDAPLDKEKDDRLDRRHFAAAVARLIRERADRTSVVLAIYAPWGDGKTTVLNWVRHRLDHKDSGVVVVRFNPWLVRDELALLPVFFATITEALGKRLGGRKAQISGLLQRYGRVVSGLAVGIPGVSFDPGETIAKLGEALSGKSIEEMRQEFEAILREEGQRLLVIIDDVDRLDDDETHSLFKLVKLAADFEGITYLMAFDDEKVAAALAKRYSNRRRQGEPDRATGGFEFLEKIVQVPLRLPRARQRAIEAITLEGLQAAITEAAIQLNDEEVLEFRTRFAQGLSPAIHSVRTANRYVSTASFALALLRGEACPIDVLTIEGMNACYPSVYSAIREHPSWFLLPYEFHFSSQEDEIRRRRLEQLDSVLATVDPEERDAVRLLLQRLFPQTQDVWAKGSPARANDGWAAQQRICSAEYFDRYFAYGVGSSEIGDQELDALLADPGEYDAQIAELVNRKGLQSIWALLEKADRRLQRLQGTQLVALGEAVTQLGPLVATDDEPRFFARNLLEETAAFIARLLMELPEGEVRTSLAQHVTDTAEPLTFAAECVRWMRVKKSDVDSSRALDDETAQQLVGWLAIRIAHYAEGLSDSLWENPGGFSLMYWAERGAAAEQIKAHTARWLLADPKHVVSLLVSAAGRLYGASAGPEQDDLTTDKYEALGRIANMERVSSAVRTLRADAAAPIEFPVIRYMAATPKPTGDVVLDQFAWQEARAAAAEAPPADA